jgi:hypothetical protein
MAGNEDGGGSAPGGLGQSRRHEGGDTAGRDADRHIARPEPSAHRGSGSTPVILRAFTGAEDRPAAAGEEGLHRFRGGGEGRRAFRGLKHPEPPTGAGADEEEPPAARQPGRNQPSGGGDGTQLGPDDANGPQVFTGDKAEQGQEGQAV